MRTSGITEIGIFLSLIDLIHDTRRLCTCSRTDVIKAMPRGFSGSNNKKFSTQEIAVKFVILDNRQ